MEKSITKIKLKNFKKFRDLTIVFDSKINLLIGDNEAGKSSILIAIDTVLSGSRNKVETIGVENLFNIDAITEFLEGEKKIEDLPTLSIELFLNEQNNFELSGKSNSTGEKLDGLKLICEPRFDLSNEIKEILEQEESNFPYEYYSISFKTFADQSYTGYKKYLKHLLIDNTQINNEYATKEYVKKVFSNHANETDKNKFQNAYRKYKDHFKNNVLNDLNEKITDDYAFSIKTGSKYNLDSDLTISEGSIDIENKGKGRQCFIKTKFALQKADRVLDVVLLEEPENHLSHINMKKLIKEISDADDKQLFIATHSDLVSTRLDLRKAILLNNNSSTSIKLKDLSSDTAKFFMKAPDNNILQFILSNKVILVEGDAEYILMEDFFKKEIGISLEESGVHIISVGGLKFKRYLEIAKLLNIKTAFITDNDKDYTNNCTERYKDFVGENIKLFSDEEDEIYTFEVAIYKDNTDLCDNLFNPSVKTVQEYMLDNKANCAFKLLDEKIDEIEVPEYIKDALVWINE
jgi:predicted ATP-dependent endonuclease of OLD family